MKKWISCLIYIALIAPLFVGAQDRSVLENKRLKIIEELEVAEAQVTAAENEKIVSTKELNALNNQINSREKLITNLKAQLSSGMESMNQNKDSLLILDKRIKNLKESYAKLLNVSYVKRRAADSWLSLFSATSANEAILRYRYQRQFAAFLNAKEREITSLKSAIRSVNMSISEEQDYTQQLLTAEKVNFKKLAEAKAKKKEIVSELKSKSEVLKKELDKKRKEREKLNQQIERIILEELEKRKKAKASSTVGSFAKKNSLEWPVLSGYISGRFGEQSHPTIKGLKINNNGVDISCKPNSNVRAIQAGTVVGVTNIPGFDIMIIIEHGNHYTVYSKMKIASILKGDNVENGHIIGEVGDEGILHFELWKEKEKLNPEKWLKKK